MRLHTHFIPVVTRVNLPPLMFPPLFPYPFPFLRVFTQLDARQSPPPRIITRYLVPIGILRLRENLVYETYPQQFSKVSANSYYVGFNIHPIYPRTIASQPNPSSLPTTILYKNYLDLRLCDFFAGLS